MTDVIEGVLTARDIRPPKLRKSIEEIRSDITEYNDRMSAWLATEPVCAGLHGPQPIGRDWHPREVPEPEQPEARDLGAGCPECDGEQRYGGRTDPWDHTCNRRQRDMIAERQPQVLRTRRPVVMNPETGETRMIETWLKPGVL